MADNIIVSKQDAAQVLRLAFDDTTKSLRVQGSSIPGSMTVDQADGSLLHTTVDQSALPDGAATEAKQDDQITALNNIVTTSGETSTNTLAGNSLLTDIKTNTTGIATEAKQDDTISAVASLETAVSKESTLAALSDKVPSGLVSVPFDSMVVTYVGATDDIDTVVYKLGATTVKTLTLSYDGNGRLSGVVAT